MKIRSIVVILAAMLSFSCDQYPIFYAIYQEVEPTKPRIKGNPTVIVEIEKTEKIMYVASRFGNTLHSYSNGNWSAVSSPGGGIMELASDGASLYALVGDPLEKTDVYVYKDGSQWERIPLTGGVIQTIRGTKDYIFASTESGLFFYKKGNNSFSSWLSNLSKEHIVTGADVVNTTYYYVAVVNKGIYTFDENALSSEPVEGTAGKAIVGMLAVKDTIVAVSRDGYLLYGNSSNGFKAAQGNGVIFSGAMGIWRDKEDNTTQSLLLVGIQGSSYSTVNGYREILLKSDGSQDVSLDTTNLGLRTPGSAAPTTVSNTDKYISTLGLRVVTSLYQAGGILFASTMKNGLWSYRIHQGENEEVWNAEE
jgi:hypothetical protein